MKVIFFFLFTSLLFCFNTNAKTIKALFLGNSYTSVNNLPEIIKQIALTTNDTLIFSANTPGGHTLQGHFGNATSIGLIQQGGWDYVILQEQSQLPSFPEAQVQSQVYPYATKLDSIIRVYNPCAKTLFYMTWGRKNGDQANCAGFPPLCTYEGMDDLLQLRYTNMAQDNEAVLAPVAKVWRWIRNNNPSIELYSADESHPSASGSFAAACTFYSIMFEKNPSIASYTYSINTQDATTIKSVAKNIVFDSLATWNQFDQKPSAVFSFNINNNQVDFVNSSNNAHEYQWSFGDGATSSDQNPIHTYNSVGTYNVQLIAFDSICGLIDTLEQTIQISSLNIFENDDFSFKYYPNPVHDYLYIQAKDNFKLKLYSHHGKFIKEFLLIKGDNTIDLKDLTKGIYLLQSENGQSIKIVKE